MSSQFEKKDNVGSEEVSKARVGAKETLTRELARKIVRMIEQFPDTNVVVTWANVRHQAKLSFGHQFSRNVLSQKKWDGRKLIAEAFQNAKQIQLRHARDIAPKYANEPRARLRNIVANLQSENLALRERLYKIRALQYDEIHSLLDTRTPLDQSIELSSQLSSTSQVGAKEALTYELARKIVRMIEHLPHANIAVTWENVIYQIKLRFGHQFRRNILSQKMWDGRKLIAEAFQDAKQVQRVNLRHTPLKVIDEPRARLRLVVANLQSENLALQEQLGSVRAFQYDKIHSLLDIRTPLNRLIESISQLSSMHVFDVKITPRAKRSA